MNILSQIWAWIKANDKALLVVFAIIVGIYALFEYTSKDNENKANNTSRFVELYSSAPMITARMDLRIFMENPEIRAQNYKTYNEAVKSKIDDEKLLRSVFSHLGFFDSLSTCVDNSVCDDNSACRYFFKDSQSFLEDMHPILIELSIRANEPVDLLLKHFAHDICRCKFRAYCSTVNSSDCAVFR
jgi:hypothetical protein